MEDSDGVPTQAGDTARMILVEALLEGCTITAAAERAGVARTTASVWLHTEDNLRMILANGRREIAQHHRASLSKLHSQVLERLGHALDDPTTSLAEVVSITKALGSAFTATDTEDMNGPHHVESQIEARRFSQEWAALMDMDARIEAAAKRGRPPGWRLGDPVI